MMYLSLAKTFGPYIAIALLAGLLLWTRGNLIDAKAGEAKAQAAVAELDAVNKADAATIQRQKDAAALNDQAVIDLNARLLAVKVEAGNKQIIFQKAIRNDPASKLWADTPVPAELRGAIN